MSELPVLFAAEMRRRRVALGLSQHTLGDRLDLDRNTVGRIERNAPNLSLLRAADIAQSLGTSVVAMFGGRESSASGADLIQSFRTHVRHLRVTRGCTQRELAEHLRVDRNWVSAIESGNQSITLRTVEKFAAALEVAAMDLLS